MKFLPRLLWFIALSLLWVAVRGASFGDRIALTHQHVDLRLLYSPGTTNELSLVARDGDAGTNYASTNVVLVARAAAETTIPPGFEQFGETGAPFWILPASQNPELLYLGVSAEGLPRGTFDELILVRLVEVRAPGFFFLWQFDPGGNLEMRMDSRNGIGPTDQIQPIVGSHAHFNWGFSSNGLYEVTFQVEGRLLGATTNLTAAPTPFQFAVEPIPIGPPQPAMLQNVSAVDGQLRCDLLGEPGFSYQVQTSSNLLTWSQGPVVVAAVVPVPVSVPLSPSEATVFLRALAP